ncbi:unnamed protein product [Prorocentrum cordatum]|uniref:Protein kinase domain-containing protein n=1 Tax=Prorocentrum cordatum TaxID=2364126 RepID=A0ABN9W8R1_9DINO|nr:unnamed protein product [Polarella glacialis]
MEVVLIDFGCATTPPARLDPKVSRPDSRPGARHIRAPEVVLGLCWDCEADVWSLGCTLASLYMGARLFHVHTDMEHLAMMEHITETCIPVSMGLGVAPRIAEKGAFFDRTGRLEWPRRASSEDAIDRVREAPTLRQAVLRRHGTFGELLAGMLEIEPRSRLQAAALLRGSFLAGPEVSE